MKLEFDESNLPLTKILGDALVRYAHEAVTCEEQRSTHITTETHDIRMVKQPTATDCNEVAADHASRRTEDGRWRAKGPWVDPAGLEVNGGNEQKEVEQIHDSEQGGSPVAVAQKTEQPIAVDHNGVAANYDICSKAAKPFYSSGARKGQWKAKAGLAADAYDIWYAKELHCLGAQKDFAAAQASTEQEFDAAAALGARTEPEVIADPGKLLGWLAEHQAAGRLTPEQITAAYRQTGLDMTSLFINKGAAAALHKATLPMLEVE